MNPRSLTHPRWWLPVAGILLIVLAWWALAPGGDDGTRATPTPGPTAAPGATSSASPPSSEPSSGPTETPEPGSLEAVPVGEQPTRRPVPLTATADFGTGMSLQVLEVEPVQGEAQGPGEVAGPALRVTVVARNDGADPVSLDGMVVALAYGSDRTPAATLSGPGARPFGGEVAPHDQARAVYVYAVPADERDRLELTASYTGTAPAVVLTGAVA